MQWSTSRSGQVAETTPRVQSVDRAMLLLRAVAAAAPDDSTAARLGETCGLNRATAWRILHTLEVHDVVSCDRDTGRWSVGGAIVDLAQSAGSETLLGRAHPHLESLSQRTGETAALAVWRLGSLTYVDEVRPPAVVSASWLGQTVPLHATSTGKVLLAFGDVNLPPGRLERFTDTTVTTRAALEEQLEQVRAVGYATCRGELDTSAWGVSAPVFDGKSLDGAGRLVAMLSIWGPGTRLTDRRLDGLGPLVRTTAATLLGRG
jgi:DNA-binding IclR family transcriptional regulator